MSKVLLMESEPKQVSPYDADALVAELCLFSQEEVRAYPSSWAYFGEKKAPEGQQGQCIDIETDRYYVSSVVGNSTYLEGSKCNTSCLVMKHKLNRGKMVECVSGLTGEEAMKTRRLLEKVMIAASMKDEHGSTGAAARFHRL